MKRIALLAACAAVTIGSFLPINAEELRGNIGKPTRVRSSPLPQGGEDARWVGYAVSRTGRIFRVDYGFDTDLEAKQAAVQECQEATLTSCSGIGVLRDTVVMSVICRDGSRVNSFIGGSTRNAELRIALDKAIKAGFFESDCRPQYTNAQR